MATWTKTTDERNGWTTYTRGDARITVPPSGGTPSCPVVLFVPGCTSTHKNVNAAKRAARR